MRFLTLLILATISLNMSAQTLDEELGFIYVKADYLMETGRYDDAIKEFTKIIAKNPSFRDALYRRADAKYNVGAYQGTYNDLLQVFELQGITPEALKLFGQSQKSLGNDVASETTLETAGLITNTNSAREKANTRSGGGGTTGGTERTTEEKVKDKAETIKDQISSILDDLLPDDPNDTTQGDDRTTSDETTSGNDRTNDTTTQDRTDRQTKGGSTGRTNRNDDVVVDEPHEVLPEVDDSVREIYIDEDVTLEIKNGLGARRILQQPSILILSETSGTVVVDICVNNNGKVTQAEFNAAESSLKTQSIISLAVRKSKEFWFKSSPSKKCVGRSSLRSLEADQGH